MAKTPKGDLNTGANTGRQLDRSGGFQTRDEYTASLVAQAKTGKLNRQLRRAVKALKRTKGKKP